METNKTGIGALFIFFTFIMLGMSFIQVIGSEESELGATYLTINESKTMTAGVLQLRVTENVVTSGVIAINSTNGYVFPSTNYTIGTDGTLTRVGTAHIGATDTLNVTYNYHAPDYVESSSARSMTSLIGLLFAVIILGGAIYYTLPYIKDFF